MRLIRSMVLAVCAVSAIDGELLLRRYLMNGPGPGGDPLRQGGVGPGGDPSHQGGLNILNPPQQQLLHKDPQCVSKENPCRCPMHYATNLGCLKCDCHPTSGPMTGTSPMTSSTPAVPLPAVTTTTPTSFAPSTPPAITTTTAGTKKTTTIDYCDVAKQLCQANCPDGYLVDPGDCTFCICKKDVLPG